MTEYKRQKFKKPLRLVMRRVVYFATLVLVLALIPFFLWQQTRDDTAHRFSGLVEAESETVGPVETARILSVEVQPGQYVQAGDVLVRLEASDRAMDLAMNEARLKDYEQGLVRYRQTLRESERRSRQGLQEATVALESEKMNRVRDEAELTGVNAEIARLQPLVARRLVSETELSSLRPKAEALEHTVKQYEPLITVLEQRCKLAADDLAEVQALLKETETPDTPADPAYASMRQVVDEYRGAYDTNLAVLRASRPGVVSRVLRQPGDVVVAGEPVVRVTAANPSRITGMLAQRQMEGLTVGDKMTVMRAGIGSRQTLAAMVEVIEPEFMDLLEPLNPAPRYPTRGCRVRLRVLDEFSGLIPGEAVVVTFQRRETFFQGLKRLCAAFTSGTGTP